MARRDGSRRWRRPGKAASLSHELFPLMGRLGLLAQGSRVSSVFGEFLSSSFLLFSLFFLFSFFWSEGIVVCEARCWTLDKIDVERSGLCMVLLGRT